MPHTSSSDISLLIVNKDNERHLDSPRLNANVKSEHDSSQYLNYPQLNSRLVIYIYIYI